MDMVYFTSFQIQMTGKWLIVVLLLAVSTAGFGQEQFPFQLHTKREISILLPALSVNLAGYTISNRMSPLQQQEIINLKSSDIYPAFDRRAAMQFSLKAKRNSDVLLFASYVLPAALFFAPENRKWNHANTLITMGFESMLVSNGITQLVKGTARRTRPFVYNPVAPDSWKLKKDARMSFFSGHTSTSATACFYTAYVYTTLYPQSKWRYAVWTGAAALPLTIGYYRYKAGKHFPTDIITGYVAGALCGLIVPRLHRTRF